MRVHHVLRYITVATLVVAVSACSGGSKTASNPECPVGVWQLAPEGLRLLLGAETTGSKNDAATSGTVTMTLSDANVTYEFQDVVLAGVSQGSARTIGITGVLTGTATYTPTTVNSAVATNTLFIKVNGLPAGEAFTSFASSELERNLMGASTYTCAPTALRLTNATTNDSTVWNATRAPKAK